MDEKETSVEEKMVKFKKLHNKVLYRSFGKVQIKQNSRTFKEIQDEGESAEEILINQRKEAEIEIEKLKAENHNKANRIWELKKKVVGGKKATNQATAIVDPETGKMVVSKHKIKEVTLKYCKDTLENNQLSYSAGTSQNSSTRK
jgi:glutamate synthase domain-containing protein 2